MDVFEEVRNRVSIVDTCKVLGIKLSRNYKAICPFSDHKEKTPSFSISVSKNIFCCFGCGKKGNSITLVQELLKTTPLESAKFLNEKLGLGIDFKNQKFDKSAVDKYMQKKNAEKKFREWENKTFQLLCDYFHLLKEWEKLNNPEDYRYITAVKELGYISYIIDDIFIYGEDKDKLWFKRNNGKVVERICKIMN